MTTVKNKALEGLRQRKAAAPEGVGARDRGQHREIGEAGKAAKEDVKETFAATRDDLKLDAEQLKEEIKVNSSGSFQLDMDSEYALLNFLALLCNIVTAVPSLVMTAIDHYNNADAYAELSQIEKSLKDLKPAEKAELKAVEKEIRSAYKEERANRKRMRGGEEMDTPASAPVGGEEDQAVSNLRRAVAGDSEVLQANKLGILLEALVGPEKAAQVMEAMAALERDGAGMIKDGGQEVKAPETGGPAQTTDTSPLGVPRLDTPTLDDPQGVVRVDVAGGEQKGAPVVAQPVAQPVAQDAAPTVVGEREPGAQEQKAPAAVTATLAKEAGANLASVLAAADVAVSGSAPGEQPATPAAVLQMEVAVDPEIARVAATAEAMGVASEARKQQQAATTVDAGTLGQSGAAATVAAAKATERDGI